MKAKIIKTGEIVEVYHEPQHGQTTNIYKEAVLVNGRMWEEDELDFPINSESEDERIREYLISFVELNSGVNLPPEDAKKNLAWLEKQGEKIQQTPQWMIDFLNENRVKFASLMEDYDDQREAEGKLLAIIDWLEKKGK